MTDDNDSDDYFHDSSDGSSDNDDSDDRPTSSSDDGNSSPLSPSSEHLSHYTMLVVGIDMQCLWTPGRGLFCV